MDGNLNTVRWGSMVRDLKVRGTAIIPNEDLYFTNGATFSRIGQFLSARIIPEKTLILDLLRSIFLEKYHLTYWWVS